ncbi:MAG: Ribosome-binding factor [Patescibacteria group bacterium]|jgi:ribosome-binding factor A|nr:Ribosome-binding factor [Patescibacteria group bacterium]
MLDNTRKLNKLSSILSTLAADFFKTQTNYRPGIITVTGVDVSPDKSHSIVWVSLINVDQFVFEKQTPEIQKKLRKYISVNQNFRYTPNINIRIDNSTEEIQKINKLLQE